MKKKRPPKLEFTRELALQAILREIIFLPDKKLVKLLNICLDEKTGIISKNEFYND